MTNTLFKIEGLFGGYAGKAVLKDVAFGVKGGEFLGIIGPNGSGKTTLLKLLTRILRPTSGMISYKEKDLSRMGLLELAKDIAFVPQETSSAFSFTVMDIVMMGRYPHIGRFRMEEKNDFAVARAALETVKCIEFADRDIDELSAGEKQRVMIAKALAQEPNILILDEPTSRLDIGHQIEIFDLIKRLNLDKGITVISVLHDLNLASDYCDRLILMKEGTIFMTGSVDEILTYQNLEEVYKTLVLVTESPATKRPHIALVPKYK